jgi:hypothetical protein
LAERTATLRGKDKKIKGRGKGRGKRNRGEKEKGNRKQQETGKREGNLQGKEGKEDNFFCISISLCTSLAHKIEKWETNRSVGRE